MSRIVKKLVNQVIAVLFAFLGLFQRQDLVYFESFHGKQVSDNPLAIYRALEGQVPKGSLIWGASKGYETLFQAAGVPYVRRFSLAWFLTMPRAKVWVINTRTPLFLKKNRRTFYIQTWHGTPLKKIGLDIPTVKIPGYDTTAYQKEVKAEAARWDLLLAPNPYCATVFPQAFGFTGPLLSQGYPRNDALVREGQDEILRQRQRQALQLPATEKIILYAPTWREDQVGEKGKYAFSLPFDLVKLAAAVQGEAVILVRLHYLVSQALNATDLPDNVIDVSAYPDMKDLLLVTDLLVTDYSSSLFDFAITQRPQLFFIPDQAAYENDLRGLYMPMDEQLPGPIVDTPAALEEKIKTFLLSPVALISESYPAFNAQFCQWEKGQAAEQVATIILEKLR